MEMLNLLPDMLKQAKGSQLLVQEGWSTNTRESRALTGTKFSKNIKRLRRENEMKSEALRPILELENEFGPETVQTALKTVDIEASDTKVLDFVMDKFKEESDG